MKKEQLNHLIRAAKDISSKLNFLIIGSQAVIGDAEIYAELEKRASSCLQSPEIDVMTFDVVDNDIQVDEDSTELLEWGLGETSRFFDTFGYYLQAVSIRTAKLPNDWKLRLNRSDEDYAYKFFISIEDLIISKLAAGREKDFVFLKDLLKTPKINIQKIKKIINQEREYINSRSKYSDFTLEELDLIERRLDGILVQNSKKNRKTIGKKRP